MCNKYLLKCSVKPNYPVAEGVILYLTNTPDPIVNSAKHLAKELGFAYWDTITEEAIVLVGELHNQNYAIFDDYPHTVLYYETGEY